VTGEEAVEAVGRGKERTGGCREAEVGCRRVEWKEGWKLSRRLSVDITVASARHGTERKKEKQGRGTERQETRGKRGREGGRVWRERERRGIRDFVCLPVRPSEPEGTSAAASLEEELGRETNTSAEETTAGEEGE
jgi:hypothetical protein